MKFFRTSGLVLFLFLLPTCAVWAQSIAEQRCASLGKGMNISNWLERGWDGNWPTANGYSKHDLELMKEAGITSIRLPIYFYGVVDTIAPYTVDTAHPLFSLVDSVIKWSDELDMKLLIDNHHGWKFVNEDWRDDLPRFSHLWGVVAERYRHLDPNRVMFELLNEPTLFLDQDSLRIFYSDAIDSIRQYTAEHSIVVSPHFGGSALVLPQFEPMADTNIIYTWHVYDPLDFSHQGLIWHEPYFPSGNPFPHTDPTTFEGWLYDGWQNVIEWKQTHQKPIFLGEFGLSTYCDSLSVCKWLEYSATRLVQNDIPWFYWDWQWDFSMFRSNTISEDSIFPCYKHYLGLYGDETFTDVQQVAERADLNVYPNPATDWFDVRTTTPMQLSVFDVTGRMLMNVRHLPSERIDVSNWKKGLYLIVAYVDNRVFTTRLVVQ